MKPFLKWAGGKAALLEQYAPYIPANFNHYYEPFVGGGAMFFHLTPKRASLSDANPELINAYVQVRDRPQELIDALFGHWKAHSNEHYYLVRGADPLELTTMERAARFVYLNKTCFNGLYRENKKGQFNVPIGRYKNPAICDRDAIMAASKALKGVEIYHAGWAGVDPIAGDFVFLDPPYHLPGSFKYDRYGFGPIEHTALRDLATHWRASGVQVLLANSDCEFIRDLYSDWKQIEIKRNGNISSKKDGRQPVGELLMVG